MVTCLTPDVYAVKATALSKAGLPQYAMSAACMSIKARAYWVLVNGKWTDRRTVMRK